ncbi:hypothetical protein PMAYCL1PPCAC_18524, partial [Pristionchus mayeri]
MSGKLPYSSEYENPPPVVEAISNPPTALQAEEFVGESYGPLGLRKRNADPDNAPLTKFARGAQESIKKSDDKKKSLLTSLRELTVHFLFLTIVCIISFSACSSSTYYFTTVINNLFTQTNAPSGNNFAAINGMDDIWEYMNNQLMAGLYWDSITSNDTNLLLGRNESDEEAMIFYENRLLGRPRIRMLKVKNDSCDVVDSFAREIKACYSNYDKGREDKADFTPEGYADLSAFKYTTADELENRDLWGAISTYGGGGFVQYLSENDKNQSMSDIAFLKANRWIDRGTRLIVIDFSVYNGNLNLFCIIKLIFELPATGGVIPMSQFTTLRLIRYVTTFDIVVLVCEGIFIAFTVIFIFEEMYDIYKTRLSYFKEFWNVVDIVVIGLSIACIILSFIRTNIAHSRINKLIEGNLTSSPMDDVVSAENNYTNIAAIILFFAWIKVFKYISFNKTMSQLSATLSRSAKDIGGFAVMFFVFFFAYAQFGYLVFGTQIKDYSTFYDAVFALLRTILGDFDFHALERANRVLGPLFFITYVFFVFFVLLNMFLAIINDTYVEVKAELARQPDDFQVASFLSRTWYRFLRAIHLTKEIPSLQSQIDFDAWKTALRRSGYNDGEINEKFAKYEVLSWKEMDEERREELEDELERELREREKRSEQHRDLGRISRRVEGIETSILSISTRFEAVAERLRKVELDKV